MEEISYMAVIKRPSEERENIWEGEVFESPEDCRKHPGEKAKLVKDGKLFTGDSKSTLIEKIVNYFKPNKKAQIIFITK